MEPERSQDAPPRSAVSAPVGIVGVIGLIGWTTTASRFGLNGPFSALTALLACGLPMIAWSLFVDKVHRNPTTGIDWSLRRPWREAIDGSLVKLAGLWATWGVIAFCYCVGRWYWSGSYLFAMHSLRALLPVLLILSVPYVLWLERRLIEPRDSLWAFGQWLLTLGRDPEVTRSALADHARAWMVKGFFIAFMFSTLPGNWAAALTADPQRMLDDPVALADGLIAIMFLIDVNLATVGYLLTMRPLDSHIRSANPYAAAWMAALICYPPFIMMNPGGPLDYSPGQAPWSQWLAGHPMLLTLDAFALIALTGVYAWATMAFGLRFSNLTHRGILTNGPYRFSKHPAYLAKNLFWWLSTMPFLATTALMSDRIRNTAILAIISGVYYWRARTEERHLSADPVYRDYAEWMARHAPVPRFFRAIADRFRPARIQAAE